MFLAFLGPPSHLHVSVISTVNQQKLPFSDPTHPPLCCRNIEWSLRTSSVTATSQKYSLKTIECDFNLFLTPLCHTIQASLHFPSSRFNCCRVSQIRTFWHFLGDFFHKYWSWVLHAGDQVTNCWNSIDHGLHFDLTSHYHHCTALPLTSWPPLSGRLGGFHKWH